MLHKSCFRLQFNTCQRLTMVTFLIFFHCLHGKLCKVLERIITGWFWFLTLLKESDNAPACYDREVKRSQLKAQKLFNLVMYFQCKIDFYSTCIKCYPPKASDATQCRVASASAVWSELTSDDATQLNQSEQFGIMTSSYCFSRIGNWVRTRSVVRTAGAHVHDFRLPTLLN